MPKLMEHILGKLSKCEWLIGGKLKMYFGISLLREEGLGEVQGRAVRKTPGKNSEPKPALNPPVFGRFGFGVWGEGMIKSESLKRNCRNLLDLP